ncbi:MAG: hypothetical protein U0Q16_08150 [Bryobacteraceae bacterium]
MTIAAAVAPVAAQDTVTRARDLENRGDSAGALALLREAAQQNPPIEANLVAYAEALDRHNYPEARQVYGRVATTLTGDRKLSVLKRLVVLDLLAGDRSAAEQHLSAYRDAGGNALPESLPSPAPAKEWPTVDIPGPVKGFNRMAALSPDLRAEDLLPALARNVVTQGYQASNSQEALEQTEYLKLVFRYLSQARELDKIAGADKKIVIETCDSAKTGELLKVVGYRMRGQCGGDVVLETVNAMRAFVTIDSGFPLAELEQALRTNRPFTYDYKPTKVPVMYGPEYWLSAEKKEKGEFIDTFMSDPALCRLYLGLSKLDAETADDLRKAVPAQRLKAFAHVLDFFGGMFLVRGGKVAVPGGTRAEAGWADLVGAQPSQGGQFMEKLLTKDDGWVTSYFDSLSRIEGPTLAYLTDPERMKRFYTALRGRVTSPGPARPVFRSNTDLMLLTTRLMIQPNGQPHLPGGLEMWKNLFVNHPHGKYDGKLTKSAANWKQPDDVIEALFGLCRKAVENEPLKIFMALTDVDRHRSAPLATATADRLARNWRLMASQFPVFTEVPTLSDQTIIQYVDFVNNINGIKNQSLRADAAGTSQALVGLWQILARNGAIPLAKTESTLASIAGSFTKIKDAHEVFSAGVAGVRQLLEVTNSPTGASVHDRMLDLLAGTTKPRDEEAHQQMVQDMVRVFESQKLISLKTVVDLGDHLDAMAKGEKFNPALLTRLTARMQEVQLPRASLTGAEKNALSFGYWTEKHIEVQRRMNLRANLEKPGVDAGRLNDARAQLTPVLRDTLVGFNYLYYAPPGAQLLKTNPLFVRSHDFLGVQGTNQTWRSAEVLGTGWPSSAGGRLVGSLAGLPYALAEAEQNFMIPTREGALIWGDLVPQMILSAKIPRWWNVTPAQIHWVGLSVRNGESLLAESTIDPKTREWFLQGLAKYAAPARVWRVGDALARGDVKTAIENVTASEFYQIGHSGSASRSGDLIGQAISELKSAAGKDVAPEAISRAFGTPKPTLTTSMRPELLNLRTFPTLMGYSSRIMAESWESSILYYVALADEIHMSPDRLNLSIPEWTQHTVERIFATHLEDWPALLRSLRAIGDDVRAKTRRPASAERAGAE